MAVVIAARNDANKGDERACQWLHQVGPYVLGMVFPDLDPAFITVYLQTPRPVVQLPKVEKPPRRRAA